MEFQVTNRLFAVMNANAFGQVILNVLFATKLARF